MQRLSRSTMCVLAAMLALGAGARAAPSPGDVPAALPAPLPPQSVVTPAPSAPPQFGHAAADALLADARGGSDRTTIDTTLGGTVSGNAASNVVTGSNVIQSGSFANMSGIPIVVQNTGANVLIQNATVINLQLK